MFVLGLNRHTQKCVRNYSRSIQAAFAKRGKKFRKTNKKKEERPKREFGMYNLCLMRDIAPSLKDKALRSSDAMIEVDLVRAKAQHAELADALLSTGCDLVSLPSNDLPDSVFIEDSSVVIDDIAMLTHMGAVQRRPEVNTVSKYLKSIGGDLKVIHNMPLYATVDGGDVLFTGKEIFVGLSKRTNQDGVHFIRETFSNFDVHEIDMTQFDALHLKSACSMCFDASIMVGGEVGLYIKDIVEMKSTSSDAYNFFHVPDMVAANGLLVNDTLIRRHDEEFPESKQAFEAVDAYVKSNSGSVVQIRADELAKVDGALTCCCLLLAIW